MMIKHGFSESATSAKDAGGTNAKPPNWTTRQMAENYSREALLKAIAIDGGIYLLFLTFVLLATVGQSSPSMYYLTRAMQKQFIETSFETANGIEITFSDIKTTSDFWSYLENVFCAGFNWDVWNWSPVPEDSDHKLHENRLLGVPRIRQLKVRSDTCHVHEYFTPLFQKCFGPYTWSNQDTEPFGPKEGTAWTYSSPDHLGGTSFDGKMAYYYAGGYYQDLSNEEEKIRDTIGQLKESLWITRGTRVVFIDFTIYNANLNLFAVCRIVFEFPPIGGVIPSTYIRTLHVINSQTFGEYFAIAASWFLIVFVLFFIAEVVREVLYFKLEYIYMFWSYIDVTIVILLLGIVVCNIQRTVQQSHVDTLITTKAYYSDFENVVAAHTTFNNVGAILVLFTFLKLFKFISFNKTMGQLNSTLKNCASDLLGFLIMFFIIFLAYAELGYLLFGPKVESYSTFGASMFTLLRTILGDFDYIEIKEANWLLAPVFFLSYIFFVFFVLLNMFLAIINDTYADVKEEIDNAPEELGFFSYIARLFCKKCGKRRGYKATDEKVEPKEVRSTTDVIRDTLEQLGYTKPEIDMFLDRYTIDPDAEIDEEEMQRLLKHGAIQKDDGNPVIKTETFLEQQKRLTAVERAVGELATLTNQFIDKLDELYSVDRPSPTVKFEDEKEREEESEQRNIAEENDARSDQFPALSKH